VPIGDGLLYGFAVLNRPAGAANAPEDRLARFRAAFVQFGEPAPAVLRLLSTPEQLIHADIEKVTLRRWVPGPVALLGDAAHAMTPNLGIRVVADLGEQLVTCRCNKPCASMRQAPGLAKHLVSRKCPTLSAVKGCDSCFDLALPSRLDLDVGRFPQ
jgi:hypothetical protein